MLKTLHLKSTFFSVLWLIPVVFGYAVIMVNSDIYSGGKALLAFLLSLIPILGACVITPDLYNHIQEDVVSVESPKERTFKTGLKINIFMALYLVAVFWAICQSQT